MAAVPMTVMIPENFTDAEGNRVPVAPDEYLRLRSEGLYHAVAQEVLGLPSSRADQWNKRFVEDSDGRHDFQVEPTVGEGFWTSYPGGAVLETAAAAAGANRATGYFRPFRVAAVNPSGSQVR